MLMIDDILLFPFSFGDNQILPNYISIVFKVLHKRTLEEMYPLERIKNTIKENRMLYEFNEITKGEYENLNVKLMQQLKMAQKVRDIGLGERVTTRISG